mmetsp:Transcript_5515/g.14333  ORF Transcript_5515/g.14333 Transcript_5515/m.14333 type:complete len:235 (-) Transcript_5515:874-1578(-)
MHVSSRKMGHCRSMRSLASCRSTGISAISSMNPRAATAAWKLVPHPTNISRRDRFMVFRCSDNPPSTIRGLSRPRGNDGTLKRTCLGVVFLPGPPVPSAISSVGTWLNTLDADSSMRPRMEFSRLSGCSKISFSMKWSYSPFMICSTSMRRTCASRTTSRGIAEAWFPSAVLSLAGLFAPDSSLLSRVAWSFEFDERFVWYTPCFPSRRCTMSPSSSTMTRFVCSTTAAASLDR